MWDDPVALNRVSRLLVVSALLCAGYVLGRQAAATWLPIRAVEVSGADRPETRQGVRPAVSRLSGDLFSVDLEAARLAFETLPWVRSATVRRVWPDRMVVALEEHVPAAAWNESAMLNNHGEVFPVRPWPGLPRVYAPEGMELEVWHRYREFVAVLQPAGWEIDLIRVDARYAWQLGLRDAVTVDLGRERLVERLRRFITFYPLAAAQLDGIRRVDMRYPNGFAVQARGAAERQT